MKTFKYLPKINMKNIFNCLSVALALVVASCCIGLTIKGYAAEPSKEEILNNRKAAAQQELKEAREKEEESRKEITELEESLELKKIEKEEIGLKIKRLRREIEIINGNLGHGNLELGDSI